MINPMHTIAIRLTAFDDSVPEFKTVAERDAYHAMIGKLVLYGLPSGQYKDQVRVIDLHLRNPKEVLATYYPIQEAQALSDKEDRTRYVPTNESKIDDMFYHMQRRPGNVFVMGAVKDCNGEWSTHS
jgi:hypothetical protein